MEDADKRQAWYVLWKILSHWSEHAPIQEIPLDEEQLDYLAANVLREAFPGESGKRFRGRNRRMSLAIAVARLKHQEPNCIGVNRKIAEHYGVSESLVKKSRREWKSLIEVMPKKYIRDPGHLKITWENFID